MKAIMTTTLSFSFVLIFTQTNSDGVQLINAGKHSELVVLSEDLSDNECIFYKGQTHIGPGKYLKAKT